MRAGGCHSVWLRRARNGKKFAPKASQSAVLRCRRANISNYSVTCVRAKLYQGLKICPLRADIAANGFLDILSARERSADLFRQPCYREGSGQYEKPLDTEVYHRLRSSALPAGIVFESARKRRRKVTSLIKANVLAKLYPVA